MKVTNIIVDKFKPQDLGLCAEFTIELNKAICIHKIYVVRGQKGLFITFPNTRISRTQNAKQKYFDIVHPTNNEVRQHIEQCVLEKYNSML